MRKLIIALILVLAAVATIVFALADGDRVSKAREAVTLAQEDLRKKHADLLKDPEAHWMRSGKNGFDQCIELRTKLKVLEDKSRDDERGDWWSLFSFGADWLEVEDAQQRQTLYKIALEETAGLLPDVRKIADTDFILLTPNDKRDFEVMPVLATANLLRYRVDAQLELEQKEGACADAELLCRFVSIFDGDAAVIHAMIMQGLRSMATLCLLSVSEATRDAEWYGRQTKVIGPPTDAAAVLRNERVVVYDNTGRWAMRPLEELEKAVKQSEWLFKFTDVEHMLTCSRDLLLAYFDFVAECCSDGLDLADPDASRTTFKYLEKLGTTEESYSAYVLQMVVSRLEEKALFDAVNTVAIELRKLELANVDVAAETKQVKTLLGSYPGIELAWNDDTVTVRASAKHPRFESRDDLPPHHEYHRLNKADKPD
jgi:hypothetical protein